MGDKKIITYIFVVEARDLLKIYSQESSSLVPFKITHNKIRYIAIEFLAVSEFLFL